jgi:N-acetylmuramoyl-L-alanine amidase
VAEPHFVRQVMRSFGVATGVAAILATVFTAWTPASLSPGEWVEELLALADGRGQTGDLPAEDNLAADGGGLRVGIVAGHSGPHPETGLLDPGATCPDGLTELEVNLTVADLVVRGLQAAGLQADLLEEWDARLTGYRAAALVSIHADSCLVINAEATGYKVAAALDTAVPDKAQRLVACLVDRYGRASELPYHPASITRDMTAYHTFYEIHSQTPAAIIETGFLYLDRDFLTRSPERAARGIVEGILCYVYNEPVSLPGESIP